MSAASDFFLGFACVILFLSSLGALKLPDFYLRMAAASKGSGFAIGLFSLAAVLHHQSGEVLTKMTILIVFLFVGIPVAGHLLGRTGFRNGVKPVPSTQVDKNAHRI